MSRQQRKKLEAGLYLYKQKESEYWWIDATLKGERARVSTKELREDIAEHIAISKYSEAKAAGTLSVSFQSGRKTLEQAVNKALKRLESKKTASKDELIRMTTEIGQKIRDKHVAKVTNSFIENDIKKYKSKTRITMRRQCWKMIIEAAKDLKILNPANEPRLPETKDFEREKGYYAPISLNDRIIIRANFKNFIEAGIKDITKENREVLRDYLKFIETTGVRAGQEAVNLRFCDIKEEQSAEINKGKIHSKNPSDFRTIHLRRRAVQILKRIAKKKGIKWHKRERYQEYVFSRSDNKVPKFEDAWKQLLKFCGIKNKEYRVYSFRKNYITRQAIKGAQIHAVAKQCGTSIEMIEQYYDKSNTNDIAHLLK